MKITKAQLKQIIKEELLKENLDDPFWRKDADALQLLQKGGAALKSILAKASPEDLKALKDYLYAPMGASIREVVLKEAHWLTYKGWQKVFKENPGLLPELRRRVFGNEAKTSEILRFLRDVVDGVEGLRLSFTDPEGIEDLKLDFEAWKEEKEQNVVNLDFMIDEPPLTEE